MQDKFIDEVIALHQFFEAWLSGTVKQTQPVFARFKAALAEGFTMVEPGGKVLCRDELLETFWRAHGTIPQPFAIRVKHAKVRLKNNGLGLVIYEEWQRGEKETARVNSALLREMDDGLQWLHVHETWMPFQ